MNSEPLPPAIRPPQGPSLWHRLDGWRRALLDPSAWRRSWRPRLAVTLIFAGAIALPFVGDFLATWQRTILTVIFLALGPLVCYGSLKLLGPVLFYDLVRQARRGRTFVLRGAYALALLVVLFLVYSEFVHRRDLWDSLFHPVEVGIQELAEFGARFFWTFLAVQFATVFLLTPAFTATAITEEKERKTLEYLFATDLVNREIVLGKLASRLLTLFVLLLGGLPILSFMQLVGGVDPNLVLVGFAAIAVSMLSLGSLGILNSVVATRPRGAVISTYVQAGAYLLFSSCCGPAALSTGAGNPVGWPAAGNIFVAYYQVMETASSAGGTTGVAVQTVLFNYVCFHALAAIILAGLATWRLRAWNREPPPKAEREAVLTRRRPAHAGSFTRLRLPRVGPDPILWKELHAEVAFHLQPLARGVLTFLAGALLAGAAIIYLGGVTLSLVTHGSAEFATVWVRIVGTGVSCAMILAVAMRASVGLSSERDRQTLDSLLMTPLTNQEILRGKWLGSVLGVRPAWWILGAVWLLGLAAGGLHLLSLVLLLAAWTAYAAFAASLGLWFSLHCRTTLRATTWTLIALLLAAAAPYLLGTCMGVAIQTDWFQDRPVTPADMTALTPPGAFATLAFGWGSWYSFDHTLPSSLGHVALAWASVCGYGAAAAALWLGIRRRFGPITGRMS